MSARQCALVVAAILLGIAPAAMTQPSGAAPKSAPSTAAPAAAAAAKAGAAGAEKNDPENQPTLRDDKDVIEASTKWLELIDRARYGAAWDLGAKSLKSSASRKTFVDGIARARKPYGRLAERKPGQFARAHAMPNAPDGDYALVSFETRFANGKTADEQVIWYLEPDSVWRVSGYFIR